MLWFYEYYHVFLLVVIGLCAGLLSGVLGVGGGVVMVPLMLFLLGFSQYEAQGTSLAVLVPLGNTCGGI